MSTAVSEVDSSLSTDMQLNDTSMEDLSMGFRGVFGGNCASVRM